MNPHQEDFVKTFENPDEQGELVTEEFIEVETPDFENTYREIKHIIFDGFIPVKLNFGESNLIVKSIYDTEFKYIDLITNKPEEKIPLIFLYSIVCFDGQDFLANRKNYHHEIHEIFRSFPIKVITKIQSIINAVQNYHYKSYENLEGYLYEKESRAFWDVYNKSALNLMFPQITQLGYNGAQESWVMFNQREDERLALESEYNIAKFVVSGYIGGKEIKKINQQEKMRWTEELKRRQDVKLKNKFNKIRLSAPTNTAEELVKELERQIKGEKDQHDRIIEIYEKRILDQVQNKKKELEIRRLEAAEAKKDVPEGVSGSYKPVSKQEMERASKEKKIPVNPDLLRQDHQAKYSDKLNQTSAIKKMPKPQVPQQKKDLSSISIFDSEVQNELKKLKKIK